LPSTNTITSYFQSYRNKQTKSKEIGNIKLNTIDKIYVTKKSDIYDKRRIEQNYNRSTIYVINNNNEALDDLKLLIGADKFVDIETLPFTKPVRQLKTKQNLLADQVSIYFLEGTKLQKNVVLSDLIKKDCTYVYCSLDFYHNTRFDFNLLHYWVSKFRTSEYKFISGTQQFLNDIKKNKIQNFISFDEWLENYSLNKEEIAEIKSHNFKNRSNANTAIYLVQLLKELGLYDVSYIKNGNSEDLSIKIPQFLLTKFKNDSKLNAESDIKSVASIVGALPLLKEFRPGLSKIAKDELMIYIDAKLPKKGNN
jgi:hypothetical protein